MIGRKATNTPTLENNARHNRITTTETDRGVEEVDRMRETVDTDFYLF